VSLDGWVEVYSLRPEISGHLDERFIHKRVYFSLFNAYLRSKRCFSLITQ
jgi:hypothetical protein